MQEAILNGTGEDPVTMVYSDGLRDYKTNKPFEGVIPNLERRYRETDSAWTREELSRFQSARPCEACNGHRLKPEALAVKIGGKHVSEVTTFAIDEAANWFSNIKKQLTPKQNEIAARILKEINARLGFLVNVGLEYLTLSRASGHAVGRREPAHPAGLADRLGADGRALRARRTVHRPAPARQRPSAGNAEAPARPRQHRDRRRT